MAFDPQNIVGKTVNSYISRPGPGKTRIYMMMFTDGSCCEFVSGKNNAFANRRKVLETQINSVKQRAGDAIDPVLNSAQSGVQQMALSGF